MANTKLSVQQINKMLGNISTTNSLNNGKINLGAINGGSTVLGGFQNPSNINILSFDEADASTHYKKYEIYESSEDLLALSCAWYRLRKENNTSSFHGISKLLDKQLFSFVNEEDRVLANNIRDYYSKKIMLWKLKSIMLTSFRQDLNEFIHSDGLKFKETVFGLAYRLPQFYFYDLKLDTIFRDTNRLPKEKLKGIETKTLRYIDSTEVDRKTLKRNEYWFADEEDNVVTVYLVPNNPLLKLWEQLIKNPITLTGLYYNKQKDDHEFYQLEKFSL